MPRDPRAWHGAVFLMLALSLAFRLVAATVATVAAIDLLVASRLRAPRMLLE